MNIGWKDDLVLFIDMNPGIFPPQERMRDRRTVEQAHLGLDDGFSGIQADANHTLGAVEGIVLAHPDGLAAVRMVFNRKIHRRVG